MDFFKKAMQNKPSINRTEVISKDEAENPCSVRNCGEAGCVVYYGQSVCICPETMQPPDNNLRCNRTISNPVNKDIWVRPADLSSHIKLPNNNMQQPVGGGGGGGSKSVTPPSFVLQQQTRTEGGGMVQQSNRQQVDLPTPVLQLVTAVISSTALLILLVALLAVLVRKWRHRHRSSTKLQQMQRGGGVGMDVGGPGGGSGSTLLTLDQLAIVGKNPVYYSADFDQTFYAGLAVRRIASDSLTLHDEIGQGAFGKVYKGELRNTPNGSVLPVAIKILKRDASRETRQDFKREVDIMGGFQHDNILTLIGIAITDDLPCMVFEFMENGDLADFLRKNDPAVLGGKRKQRLTLGQLVDMSTQIANGMVYLASQHFIHRDLATRNCLVSADLVVKISDFGMSRDVYTSDYYKIGGARMLPVRWMPPEALKYGRFTTDSDIWAYGVVLWEIFTYGKQPYYGHSNEEVIRFIEEGILLQKPDNCPDTVYHVMLGCWRTDPKDRFPFERIRRYLNEYAVELTSSATRGLDNRRYCARPPSRRVDVTVV